MNKRLTRQGTVDGAVGAFHKLSSLVGIDSKKLQQRIQVPRAKADIEKGRSGVREEAKQILEKSLVKKNPEEEAAEAGENPKLNKEHVEEILETINEPKKEEKKEPSLCSLVCGLLIEAPLEYFLIYFGWAHLEDCPVAKLPHWLFTLGVLWSIGSTASFLAYLVHKLNAPHLMGIISWLSSGAKSIAFFWGFYGMYLIWGNWFSYSDSDPKDPQYCLYSVMLTSKIFIGLFAAGWVLVITVLSCCCCCIVCCALSSESSNTETRGK